MAAKKKTDKKTKKPTGKKKAKAADKKKKVAKKKKKAAAKEKTPKVVRPTPTTGQSAPPIDLPFEKLNAHEQKVVLTLNEAGKGKRNPQTLGELTVSTGFKKAVGQEKGYIRAKNTTRRLIRSKWIEHAEEKGKGSYRITDSGRKRLRRVEVRPKSAKPVTRRKGGGKKTAGAPVKTKKLATANPNAVAPLPPKPPMATPPMH